MRMALNQARKGLGRTSPNPAVGAVIVKEGKVLAKGYHRKAGGPHAEIEALRKLDGKAPGATMYVTLEPCNHKGRTPPCTKAILESGIQRVVIGMKDPNPAVKGGGAAFLARHAIDVKVGVLEPECSEINEGFSKYVATGRPFVMVKSAQTLDGWTATAQGDSKWISGDRSRGYVHQMRNQVDAIMVGVGTVLADDPQLTCRLKGGKGKDPLRIVVDTHLRTPENARILTQDSSAGTILVEGGAGIIGSLLRGKLVDKFYIFKAPKILGGGDGKPMADGPGPRMMNRSLILKKLRVKRFHDDILVIGYPDYDRDDKR